MTEDREEQLDEIIADYLQAQEAGRTVSEQEVIASHPELAEELREFFDDLGQMNELAAPVVSQQPVLEKIRYFGDYELLEEIARGGMGIVYKARQTSLNRIVAVKLILSGHLASENDLKRFKTEAESAANLQHPHIVSVHEVGRHKGQSYFSMEYIDGKNLSEIVRDHPLPPRQAAGYVRKVAEAIHYAHQRGTLHRDLKPSNVLIDQNDRVQISDFGLAMKVEGDSELTRTGQVLGTPSYMPPEQAQHKRTLIGPGSDIYSMGAILYELLTGRPPFKADSAVETLRQVTETAPLSPRLINPAVPQDLETICLKCLQKEPHMRYLVAQELADDLACWLDGRPIKARPVGIAKRSAKWVRRHPTTTALICATAIAALSLVSVIVGKSYNTKLQSAYDRISSDAEAIRQDRDELLRLRAQNEQQQLEAQQIRYAGDMKLARYLWSSGDMGELRTLLVSHWPAPGEPDLRGFEWHYLWEQAAHNLVTVSAHLEMNSVACSPDGRYLATSSILGVDRRRRAGSPSYAPVEIIKLWDAKTLQELGTLEGAPGRLERLTFSPRAQTLAAVCRLNAKDQIVIIWDIPTRTKIATLDDETLPIRDLAFSWDESLLGIVRFNRPLSLWDLSSGIEPVTLEQTDLPASSVAFSPDGKMLAIGFRAPGSQVKLWNLDDRKELATFTGHQHDVDAVSFSPDGKILAAGARGGPVILWDLSSFREMASVEGAGDLFAFSPNGKLLATRDGAVRGLKVWDLSTLNSKIASTPKFVGRYDDYPLKMAFLPDNRTIVSFSNDDYSVRLWTVGSGRNAMLPTRNRSSQHSMAVLPDGKVATATGDELALWHLSLKQSVTELKVPRLSVEMKHIAFLPDGKRLLLGSKREVKMRELDTGHEEVLMSIDRGTDIISVTVSPDGKTLAVGTAANGRDAHAVKGRVSLIDLVNGADMDGIDFPTSKIGMIAFSPDSELLACVEHHRFSPKHDTSSLVNLWDIKTLQKRTTLEHTEYVSSIAFSPDGTTMAVGTRSESGTIFLWRLSTQEVLARFSQSATAQSLAFSPDGFTLAAGSRTSDRGFQERDGVVMLWDLSRRTEKAKLRGHTGQVESLVFTPDGRTLVAGGSSYSTPPSGDIKFWHMATFTELGSLRVSGGVNSLALSPDACTLAAGLHDAPCFEPGVSTGVMMWHAATNMEILEFYEQRARVNPSNSSAILDLARAYWNAGQGLRGSTDPHKRHELFMLGANTLHEVAADEFDHPADREAWLKGFNAALAE